MSSMSSMIPNYDKNEVKDEIILDNAENDEVDGDVDDNDSDDVEDVKPTMGRRLKSNNSSPSEEVAVILKEAGENALSDRREKEMPISDYLCLFLLLLLS